MTREEHLQFIEDHPFECKLKQLHEFTTEEIGSIQKYGNWFLALQEKKVKPCTSAQEIFVKEMNSREVPTFSFVILWKRYLRKQWEEENSKFINTPLIEWKDSDFGERGEFEQMWDNQFKSRDWE